MTEVNIEAGWVEGSDICSATVKFRTSMALNCLFAACCATARIKDTGCQLDDVGFDEYWNEVVRESLSVLTLSVAALEGFANESLFEGVGMGITLNEPASRIVAELADKSRTIEKYSLLFAFRSGESLQKGDALVQNVSLLIELRNAMIHFRPEWSGAEGKHKNLSDKLKGRFVQSTIFPGDAMLPRAWACKTFAVWALQSIVAFLDYFYEQTDTANPLDSQRELLSTYAGGAI